MDIRRQILQATLKVYGEFGYRGATTRRIAHEADVNEVTLFRHFGSKAQLIHDALQCAMPEAEWPHLPDVPVAPETELRQWARAHLEHLYEMSSVIRTGLSECEEHAELSTQAGERPRRVTVELQRYVQRLRKAGLARADVDARSASLMLVGALFADAMSRDIMPDVFPKPLARAAHAYVELFLHAIGAAPSERRSATVIHAKQPSSAGARSAAESGRRTAAKKRPETAAKDGAKTAAKDGAKTGAKTAANDAAKTGAKTAAKDGAETAAKDGANDGAKTGAKTAAKGGAGTAAKKRREEAREEGREERRPTALGGEEAEP